MPDSSDDGMSHVWHGDGGEVSWEPSLTSDEVVGHAFLTGTVGEAPEALCVETYWRGTTKVYQQVSIPRNLFPLLRELLAVDVLVDPPPAT